MEIILKKVRLGYPALYEPRAMANDPKSKPAYGARLIVAPGSANDKLIQETMLKVAEEKWPGKGAQVLKKLKEEKRVAYQEDAYRDKDGDPRPGFEDTYNLGTRSEKLKPTVKNKYNQNVAEGEQGAPYAGCYVHAAVDIWAQDHPSYGRRLNSTLNGVMFAEDGDAFGGGRPAGDSTFADLAAEPSAEDFV